jgi:hypothetical protein
MYLRFGRRILIAILKKNLKPESKCRMLKQYGITSIL